MTRERQKYDCFHKNVGEIKFTDAGMQSCFKTNIIVFFKFLCFAVIGSFMPLIKTKNIIVRSEFWEKRNFLDMNNMNHLILRVQVQ